MYCIQPSGELFAKYLVIVRWLADGKTPAAGIIAWRPEHRQGLGLRGAAVRPLADPLEADQQAGVVQVVGQLQPELPQ